MRTSSNYALRLPVSLKKAAEGVAREDGTTLNQFIVTAVAEKVASLKWQTYFLQRAERADLTAFDRFMTRTTGADPAPEDGWFSSGGEESYDHRGSKLETPFSWMAQECGSDDKPLIGDELLEAAERLRQDLTLSVFLPRADAAWREPQLDDDTRKLVAPSDMRSAARMRVNQALSAVSLDLSGLLVDICGFLKNFEIIETERGWPPSSAEVVVRIALGQLAQHYGLNVSARSENKAETHATIKY